VRPTRARTYLAGKEDFTTIRVFCLLRVDIFFLSLAQMIVESTAQSIGCLAFDIYLWSKVKYAAPKTTEARKNAWTYSSRTPSRMTAGSGPANLRFFQAETQNYAWILRSVPMEDMLASRLHTCIVATTPRDSRCGYLPGSSKQFSREFVRCLSLGSKNTVPWLADYQV
jgi:hypothetical protein